MKANVNGITIGYSDEGQGEPLVFVHAFPLNRRMWDPQVQAFSHRYRVITLDLRGHGESDAPLWRYTMDQFCEDLYAFMNHLAIDRANMDWDSRWVAISFFPSSENILNSSKTLVLADTRAGADSPEAKAGRVAMAQTAYQEGPPAIADMMIPKLLSPSSVSTRTDLVAQLRAMIIGNQMSGIVGDLMAMEVRPDSLDLLPNIHCPTLVIVGEHDVATPPSEATLMADHIPHAQLEIISQAGHVSNMENPEAFNKTLKNFLISL